ncbi:SDR family NAD(P)-dependent oxidoreductase [Rhodococcoides fascians]|uniref:SDR family NAD(P)-dependent oxidoreductase n=1 Tax=Rhodococcoides fascians TaxID=1828 RepID=UPI0009B8AC67|nr:SDR family oxidoreductase [Rhodococcus fascians]
MTISVDLSGKTVLVTGVSSGLGRDLARAFTHAGAYVVGTARRESLGRALEDELKDLRGTFEFKVGDVSQVSDCVRLVDEAVKANGGLDILVNNAAVRTDPPLMSLDEVDEANFDRVIDINLKSAFFMTKFASRVMRSRGGGVIINIASHTAEQATKGMSVYVASKAGLVQLTRATAVEFFDYGIRANVVLLGGTATGQEKRTAAAETSNSAGPPQPPTVDPSAWLTDPGDISRAIVALSDDDCGVITGASIAMDRGVTAGAMTSAFTHQLIAAVRNG